MRYAIIIETEGNGCSAYVPDLPGCIAAGDTVEEVRKLIAEAIQMHLEGMREDGDPVPEPTSLCEYVEA
jgi:predicted RNase H-like HicB family nuclease